MEAANCYAGFHSINLTWDGHEFLDKIRSHENWKDTKVFLNKYGNASFTAINVFADNIINIRAKRDVAFAKDEGKAEISKDKP